MKHKIILVGLLLSYFAFSQHTKNELDVNYIEVIGSAEIELEPNEIYLSISINEEDLKGNQSIEEVESKMITRFKGIGLNTDKQLSIGSLGGNYETYFLKKNETQTYKNYALMVNSGLEVSKVLIILDDLNISKVYVQKVSHSEIEKFRRQVKVQAAKNAREKACEILLAMEDNCGKALLVKENTNFYGNRNGYANTSMMVKQKNNDFKELNYNQNISYQKIILKYEVLAKFQILD